MKRGATDPDRVFHDTRNHHFPDSFAKASIWLDLVKENIQNKDFNNASYTFGVASHYISDSFAAPHNVNKEDSRKHSSYEKTANTFLVTKCTNQSNLFDVLSGHPRESDWYSWVSTNDKEIVYNNFKQAFLAVQSQAHLISNKCKELSTTITIKKKEILNKELKIFLTVLVIYITFKYGRPP